jgi:hypothetical protein
MNPSKMLQFWRSAWFGGIASFAIERFALRDEVEEKILANNWQTM